MSAAEQIILTISSRGYGKRTSSFEYRITGRGGKGIVAMAVNARNGNLVASMPVEEGDGIMLVTNGGQLIRCPVEGIRIAGRGTQGVTVFNTAADERVVAVERLNGEDEDSSAEAQPEDDAGENGQPNGE
jgi:DNA gyrase subunit A